MRLVPLRRHQPEPGSGDLVGPVRKDRRTKHLVKRLRRGDVAVIDHADIDRVAAEALVECRPAAVVNVASSISGQYPHAGPMVLVEAGIPLLDEVGEDAFDFLREGDQVRIDPDGVVYHNDSRIAAGEWLQPEDVRKRIDAAKDNLAAALEDFTLNTLSYVRRDRDLLLEGVDIPTLKTSMRDRHVLVVVRGHDYRKDLSTLRGYIREFRPVLIGVDGGADALLEEGYKPDVILGDMDSVTSEALACGAEVVVHAYPDGRAPGKERVEALGITPYVFPGAGTSEEGPPGHGLDVPRPPQGGLEAGGRQGREPALPPGGAPQRPAPARGRRDVRHAGDLAGLGAGPAGLGPGLRAAAGVLRPAHVPVLTAGGLRAARGGRYQ